MNIVKPIGMKTLCEEVEKICKNPMPYKIAEVKPPHLVIGLDKGNGRTTLLEYISDMFRNSGVIEHTGGIDDFLEISLDGSLPQLNASIVEIHDAGFYNNGKFSGVIGLDVSKISTHQNEIQATIVEKLIDEIKEYAVVVLFHPSNMTTTEDRYLTKIKDKFPDRIDIGVCTYTDESYGNIILKYFCNSGVTVDDSEKTSSVFFDTVKSVNISNIKEAIAVAKDLIIEADYSNGKATITEEQLLKYSNKIASGGRRKSK